MLQLLRTVPITEAANPDRSCNNSESIIDMQEKLAWDAVMVTEHGCVLVRDVDRAR